MNIPKVIDAWNLNRQKDEWKRWLNTQLGKGRKLDSLLSKLRKEMIKIKTKLKKKYKGKLNHLEHERQKEIDVKRKKIIIPDELLEFKDISIYDSNKRQSLCKNIVEGVVIGGCLWMKMNVHCLD